MHPLVYAGLENIAEAMGCSRKTLCKWIKEKEFPAFQMDGVWRAQPRDIQDWLDRRRAEADRARK